MSLVGQHYPITSAIIADKAMAMKTGADPADWQLDRKIVHELRLAASDAGYLGENAMIAYALAEAGISHMRFANRTSQTGPAVLDATTHPELYLAATRPEGEGAEAIVRAVGKAIDMHTPDALHRDRISLFYWFIRQLGLPVEPMHGKPTNIVVVKGKNLTDIFAPYDPAQEIKGWQSPYSNAIKHFAPIKTHIPTAPTLITDAHSLQPRQNEA